MLSIRRVGERAARNKLSSDKENRRFALPIGLGNLIDTPPDGGRHQSGHKSVTSSENCHPYARFGDKSDRLISCADLEIRAAIWPSAPNNAHPFHRRS
jgi:hypothetical protein